jgi:dethiobiotin synthetase
MNRGIFVTGTDTEVGKTIVTRALVRVLVDTGMRVAALKPVESGAPEIDGRLVPDDASALIRAARSGHDVSDVCAYSFPDPVSPHLAAARVGVTIEKDHILEILKRHRNNFDLIVAEGAGGLMVPLSSTLLYADLIAATGFVTLLVSPNVLGSINATLLTLEAARARGIEIAGVVLNRTPTAKLGNADAISHHGQVRVLGEFPTVDSVSDDELADAARRTLDLDSIL